MSVDCGKPRLSDQQIKHLADFGQQIDSGAQPLVFDGGFVDFPSRTEREVKQNAAKSYSRNRPKPGSRQGQRTWARPSRAPEPFRSRTHETTFGTEFRILVRHYEALSFEDEHGLWVAAKSSPLGSGGPQAFFLIALPLDQEKDPRGWAFANLGLRAQLFPLKHTNFPDASICAFTKKSEAWLPSDGITALLDHYSLWAVKSWHRSVFGWWPGRQIGIGAFYRRKEFVDKEYCGCDSGKRYSHCHRAIDNLVNEQKARSEFERLFRTKYEQRGAPNVILKAAQTKWREMPQMIDVL